jgi:cobalt-zinc-cadmium efflux system membrane fusion protein
LRAIGISADQKEPSRLLSVKAPVSGTVIDLQAAPGAFLNDATAAMMTIANLDKVWVTASVPEKDIAFVFPSQTVNVTFRSYPDDVFNGKVLFVSDVVEADTRRNKVRIAFDNPDRILKPNMFAEARFEAPAAARLMVPTSALLMTNDTTSVFVEVADWAFERRNVEIAYQEGGAVAIKTGLRPGERVVVKGGVRLND